MQKVSKSFYEFINEKVGDPTFVKLGSKGPHIEVLQRSLEALGFNLPKYGVDSKFGPETFGASQATIKTIARLTNLAELVNDPEITTFNNDGLTKTQYNIIVIVGRNQEMISQIRNKMGTTPQQQVSAPQAYVDTSKGLEKAAYDFFISKGYSPAGAAGIVSNIKHESNFKTTAVGDGGKARSLAQWHPDRFGALTKKGFNLMDFGQALAAIDYELKSDLPKVYQQMQSATDPSTAAQLFDRKFERSAGLSTNQRMRDALNIHQKYA